ncbi:hypothetical protein P2W50_31280 [Pseudomonas protegens]|uniref:hypothetical protein n=1 Tax=Pseudomonas protegens TaxID=380021 RepID=UPI0023EB9633|nr:hypothetical protein [Pseudomonas protegens]MDF4211136.1 hypothetical protein [Pseudomonas protegens]
MAKVVYTMVKSTDPQFRQKFSDGKEAGEAFSSTPASEKPSVIKTVEGKGAEFVGGTAGRRQGDQIAYTKYISHADRAFADAWNAAERNKKHSLEHNHDKEKEIVSVDLGKPEKAEVGKTYRGPIIAVTKEVIIQRHTDEKTGRLVTIEHNRGNVFNLDDKKELVGRSHQIAYPHSKSGFARELQASELQSGSAAEKKTEKSSSLERSR